MAGDAQYATVVLRLPFDGADGATSDIDKANSPATLTFQNGAKLSTTRFKYGTSSLFVDGTNDNLNTSRSCGIGAGQFTFECWIRCTGAQAGRIISNQNSSSVNAVFAVRVDAAGALHLWMRTSSGGTLLDVASASGLITQNDTQQHHIAVTRNASNRIDLWIDGVSVANATDAMNPNGSGVGYNFGSQYGSGDFYKGYVDDVRLNEGYCYYTGTFTPPTAALPTSLDYTPTGFNPTVFGTPLAINHQYVQATGFNPTHFGTPLAVFQQFGSPSGFNPTVFGTPRLVTLRGNATGFNPTVFGTPKNIPNAVGFNPTVFGTPKVRLVLSATGFSTIAFGTPRVVMRRKATTLGRRVTFGTPTTPTNRTQVATGFKSLVFGYATAIVQDPRDLAQGGAALGWLATIFGHSAVATRITCQATGAANTHFGTPAAKLTPRCIATGFVSGVTFGTPTADQRQQATGIHATHFGTPTAKVVCHATSAVSHTRFGVPSYTRSGARNASGFFCTRFGRPKAFLRFNHAATGFNPTTFGTPTAKQTHLATSIPPHTHFGTPLMRRNPRC